ncbi:glycosyltransferase family 2 protein [Daejeonella lutea]|uniref:Glycosyltransferase, catalytic subunit of cellulose synthase and poly-beta-1,6-N-acetylglucosamine synthase n=1 Tax=Daejeonella lutea TaxID=572036 RepID=A0A1T5CW90_9SPHI|nr:glycosyltransferase [Daejeonella lutea]SKB63470.1 Glycosyltransferase, catalytic subunit of cellulose synthase and poly-beta-1,6-N-acetylglucosamine synthase [Daejeonella lutea]
MDTLSIWISLIFEQAIFYYSVLIMFSYLTLVILSVIEIRKYNLRCWYINHSALLNSQHVPGISVIAPAFNESGTVINGVHTLLSLNYPKYEVIIVNDGSTDDTLQKLIDEYELAESSYYYHEEIKTQPVKGIYKSKNPVYSKLIVIDKHNGKSKADASNAGINASSYPLFLCTDMDCILHKDTLIKMVRPFVEEKTRVIATGSVIRISNSCEVENGYLKKVKVPNKFLPLFQELEYIRAFLLGRMAWSKINGLMLVSGGIGLFDKEVVLSAGGYDHKSFGEDMELIGRMRVWMEDHKEKYLVTYIPESLCWTEVPSSLRIFARQRTRWTKGLAQTLWIHRKVFFNPKYKVFGLLTFPYWVFFEWLAPLIEAGGIIFYIYLAITGQITWIYALILLAFVYSFSVMITIMAILWDEVAGMKYEKKREVFKLCLAAIVEPFVYHPLVLFFSLRGNFYFFSNRKLNWGEMTRIGFKKKKVAID